MFEHPGRETFGASVYVTRRGGTIVTCASTTGYMHEYDNRYLWMMLKTLKGCHFANYREAWTDPLYRVLRPGIGLERSQVRKIDEKLGLHPSLAGFENLWRTGSISSEEIDVVSVLTESGEHAQNVVDLAKYGSIADKNRRAYCAMVDSMDQGIGRVMAAIENSGLSDDTCVIFLSDNGPWNNLQGPLRKKHGGQIAWGSSGPLRAGKGATYEGGIRVPCVARWPGHIPHGQCPKPGVWDG